MKKKFLLGTMVPALAAAAVIGSGFSMWYFNDANSVNASHDASKTVSQLVRVGTIEKASDFTINFDQTKEGHATQVGGSHTYENETCVEATGITVKFAESATTKAVYTEAKDATYEDGLKGVDQTDDGKVYYVFTTTIKITNGLGAYVDIKAGAESKFTAAETVDDTTSTYTFTSENNVKEFDWAKDVALTYKDGKEPSSITEFKTFSDLVKNASTKISVEYRVDVYAK